MRSRATGAFDSTLADKINLAIIIIVIIIVVIVVVIVVVVAVVVIVVGVVIVCITMICQQGDSRLRLRPAPAKISFVALLSLQARYGFWRRSQSRRFSACDRCFPDSWRFSGSWRCSCGGTCARAPTSSR